MGKFNKKSQAAMEFLTTYGWAILVVMVAIGALAYFGVLNPTKTLPDRCFFGSAFNCKDYQLSYTGGGIGGTSSFAKIDLTNNLGQSITVTGVSGTYGSSTCSPTGMPVGGWTMSSDSSIITTFECDFTSKVLAQNNKAKISITLTYTLSSGGYSHTANGEVYATVQ